MKVNHLDAFKCITSALLIYQEQAHRNLSNPSDRNQIAQCRRFLRMEPRNVGTDNTDKKAIQQNDDISLP